MWTDERVDQLKTLWTEGLSCTQIARVMGGVSRNGVIGKIHRLGLAGRAKLLRVAAGPQERPKRAAKRVVERRRPAVIAAPALDQDGNHFTMRTIRYSGQCKFATETPGIETGFILCGHPSEGELPWCPDHAAIVYDSEAAKRYAASRASKIAEAA